MEQRKSAGSQDLARIINFVVKLSAWGRPCQSCKRIKSPTCQVKLLGCISSKHATVGLIEVFLRKDNLVCRRSMQGICVSVDNS